MRRTKPNMSALSERRPKIVASARDGLRGTAILRCNRESANEQAGLGVALSTAPSQTTPSSVAGLPTAASRRKLSKKENAMTKPSIVFAHGIWADGSCFQTLIPTLRAEGHEVMAA